MSPILRLGALLIILFLPCKALAAASCTPDPNYPYTVPQAWQRCYASEANLVSFGGTIIQSCVVYRSGISSNGYGEDIAYWYYGGNGLGPYGYEFGGSCIGTTYTPKNEGCPAGGSCTGDPINAGTGNLYRKEQDYGGRWLHFARDYNSDSWVTSGTVGNHWRHTYSRNVVYSAPNTATLLHEDGRAITFTLSNGNWSGDPDIHDTLTEQVDVMRNPSGWTYFRSDTLDTEQYDASGNLTSIVDSGGFLTTLTYSTASTPTSIAPAPGYLIAVTDPLGRSLQLVYGTLGTFASTTGFLKSMTDPNGNVYQYSYDGTSASGNLLSVAYPGVPTSRTFLYAESAHVPSGAALPNALTGIVDENSARNATFDFDAVGNATSTQHGNGADKFTLAYNSDGSSEVTDPEGSVTRHAFTTANSMALASTLSGPSIGFSNVAARTYDSHNNPLSTSDFDGKSTCYTYDAAHGLETSRLEGVTGGCSGSPTGVRSVQTDWDTALRKPTERRIHNASGTPETKTDWTYNARRQVLSQCQVDPAVSGAMSYACGSTTNAPTGVRQTTYAYCEQAGVTAGTCPIVGLALSVDGPRTDVSDVTIYTYYQTTDVSGCAALGGSCHYLGDLYKVTNALGQVTTYVSYDKSGRVTRMQDANGTYTDMTYHSRGWLLTRSMRANPDGSASSNDATTAFAYDNVGNVIQITQPDGAYFHYAYDAAHRLTDITDNFGDKIHYTLDAAGNRTNESTYDPSSTLSRALSRKYAQLNHLPKTLNASSTAVQAYQNPAEAPPSGITYTDGYDGNGNAIYSVDGLSAGTERQYDPLNRLIKTLQDHTGKTTATKDTTTLYAYDARDNLRSVSDPNGLVTNYTYDGLNNLTALQSPDTGNTSYIYDAAGNRIMQTDARGIVTTYTYDALNRLTGIGYPTGSLNVGYAYDQANSVTGCANSYPLGRLTKITDNSGSAVYCYDRRGNMLQKKQTVGSVISTASYTYTLADRIATITYPSGAIVTYTRNTLGQIANISYQANATANAQFLVGTTTYLPFGPINQLTFGNGRTLTKIYDSDYAIDKVLSSSASGLTLDASVDVLGNLINASSTVGANPPTQTYQYDPLYRLTTIQNGKTLNESFTYNQTGDRVTDATAHSTATYTYTNPLTSHRLQSVAGNARSYDANGNLQNTAAGTLTYDARNRLVGLNTSATKKKTPQATYNYNGKGERVIKAVGTVGNTLTPTTFVYSESGQLLGEYTAAGNKEYLYLDSAPVGLVTINGSTTQLYYLETDHVGTPRQATKPGATTASDTLVWKWDYFGGAFGTNTPNPQTLTINLRFPGQYFDSETGLNYNYFRDYEPGTGRYVESDPVGLAGGINIFSYVDSNPLSSVDPVGLLDFRYWGNWCGPGWTGGQFHTPYIPYDETFYKPPVDKLDTACMHHDKCYYKCRDKFPCQKGGRGRCMTNCDRTLAAEAGAAGSEYSSPLWWWMKNNNSPDPGDNQPYPQCGCMKDD